jgi:hypothetical protein
VIIINRLTALKINFIFSKLSSKKSINHHNFKSNIKDNKDKFAHSAVFDFNVCFMLTSPHEKCLVDNNML